MLLTSVPLDRILVEIMGENQCAMGTEMLLGNAQTKLRQLRKLGYEILLVSGPSQCTLVSFKSSSFADSHIVPSIRKYFRPKLHRR